MEAMPPCPFMATSLAPRGEVTARYLSQRPLLLLMLAYVMYNFFILALVSGVRTAPPVAVRVRTIGLVLVLVLREGGRSGEGRIEEYASLALRGWTPLYVLQYPINGKRNIWKRAEARMHHCLTLTDDVCKRLVQTVSSQHGHVHLYSDKERLSVAGCSRMSGTLLLCILLSIKLSDRVECSFESR